MSYGVEAYGLSIPHINATRTILANSCYSKVGQCPISVVSLFLTHHSDPVFKVTKMLLKFWADFWHSAMQTEKVRFERIWRQTFHKLWQFEMPRRHGTVFVDPQLRLSKS